MGEGYVRPRRRGRVMPADGTSPVDSYLAKLPPERRAVLERMRHLARRELVGFTEGLEYGMPFYRRDATTGVGFASRAGYVAIYPGDPILSELRARFASEHLGKGCVRFRRPDRIEWDAVEELFRRCAR
jgi:uncharacterized protein YdhG (YjbR/CyaY superfamily)